MQAHSLLKARGIDDKSAMVVYGLGELGGDASGSAGMCGGICLKGDPADRPLYLGKW
jgi:hypothetical protein